MRYKQLLESTIKVNTSFVKGELNRLKKKLMGKDLGNLEIEKILNKAFGKYDIEFEYGTNISSRESNINAHIVGAGISDLGNILINYDEYFWLVFEYEDDEIAWKNFIQLMQRMIGHELVHKQQMIKIRNKYRGDIFKFNTALSSMESNPDNVIKYLSKPAELMAYAYEAAEQFLQIGYKPNQIKKLLKKPFSNNSPHKDESDIFYQYTEWFESGDKVFQKFLKYMYEYLEPII